MTTEAQLEETGTGLAPRGEGWFVLNAREARWRSRDGRGFSVPFTGWSDLECETLFPQLGATLFVLGPGEPIGMYHWGDPDRAYAPFPDPRPTAYEEGWLPGA